MVSVENPEASLFIIPKLLTGSYEVYVRSQVARASTRVHRELIRERIYSRIQVPELLPHFAIS